MGTDIVVESQEGFSEEVTLICPASLLFFTFCLRLWVAQTGGDSGLTLAQDPSLLPPEGIGSSVANLIIGSQVASKHSLRTLASRI